MNESRVQDLLAAELISRDHEYVVPNTSCWGRVWEADLVSVTQSNYAIEFEIKLTEEDFRRDKEKDRHKCLKDTHTRGKDSRRVGTWRGHGPSRFFYVLGPRLDPHELLVPDYAGVISFDDPKSILLAGVRMSDAPRLHDAELHHEVRDYLSRGLMHRYWDERN